MVSLETTAPGVISKNMSLIIPTHFVLGKLGTGPVRYGRLNKLMNAAAKIGRNPVSKHKIQPKYGEWVGWRETERPNPSRNIKLSGVNGDRSYPFSSLFSWPRVGLATLPGRPILYYMWCPLYIPSCTCRPAKWSLNNWNVQPDPPLSGRQRFFYAVVEAS